MDRRTSIALTLCILGASGGCLSNRQQQTPTTPPGVIPMTSADPRRDKVTEPMPPKMAKKAKAVPEIAFANYAASSALQAKTPADASASREKARKAYQKALELDPNNKEALLGLARLYSQSEEHDRALAIYRKALEKHPKDAAVWLETGLCHARKKEWGAAIEHMKKAHEMDPENREYGVNLGLMMARAGQFDQGVAVLCKVMNKGEAHYNVARMLHRLNRPDESRYHLQMALRYKPDLTPAQQMLAHLDASPLPGGERSPIVQIGWQGNDLAPPR